MAQPDVASEATIEQTRQAMEKFRGSDTGYVAARALDLRDRWRPLAVAAIAGLVVLAPQLALYRWATGVWFWTKPPTSTAE